MQIHELLVRYQEQRRRWFLSPDGETEVVGELDACSTSQAIPSRLADESLKKDLAMMECVSGNGELEWVNGQSFLIPLNVLTNMRVSVGDVFCDYPGWRIPLSDYFHIPWKIVAFRDVFQGVAAWVRNQDPN